MHNYSIYQVIHTLNGTIYHLEAHLNLLFEAYYALFGRGVKLSPPQVQQQILSAIERSYCPKDISLFVRLELSEQGEISVASLERSLYAGYTLRCISPRAALIEFTMPDIEYPSTAREVLVAYVDARAQRCSCEVALRSYNGVVDMISGAQLFALRDNEIITAAHSHSVEHALLKRVAVEADLFLSERPILIEEIATLDELFFADHYGVTALKSCGNRTYMSIVAGSLASRLASLLRV